MRLNNIMLGSDPELFIVNNKTGKVVSSIGIIPGKKGEAYRSPDMPKGYGLQIDNILAEFNIPPTSKRIEWIDSMNYMKNYIRDYVKKVNPDYDIMNVSSAYVDESQLQSEEAKEFGCMPDYNAYTEEENPKPEGERGNLRSSGVHIHLSYDNPNINTSLELIKYFDLYLGIPSVVLDPDKERRKLYGKAGSFRLCPYGFEYRSLGGYFLCNDEMIEFMWNGAKKAIEAYKMGIQRPSDDIIQSIINNSDVEKAKVLIEKYNLL